MTKSVAEKMGINIRNRVFVQNSPGDYLRIIGVPNLNIKLSCYPVDGEMDVIHILCLNIHDLETEILEHKKHIKKDGAIWISSLKKSSAIKSDINENNIRGFL